MAGPDVVRTTPWSSVPVALRWCAAGAIVAIVGVVLPWAEFRIGLDASLAPVGDVVERQATRLFERHVEAGGGYDLGRNTGLESGEGRAVLWTVAAFSVAWVAHVLRKRRGRWLPTVMAGLALVVLLVSAGEAADLVAAARDSGTPGLSVHVGAGVWVTTLGCMASLGGAALEAGAAWRRSR
jgi:hypothetical protein